VEKNNVKPFKRILAIGSHPDDIEFGCLGYLMKLRDGARISTYVASIGSKGDPTTGMARIEESRKALSVLELEDQRFREKAGIEISDFDEIREELYDLIQSKNPDLILCLGPNDSHQEHRYTYELMITGARRSTSSIMIYGILSNTLNFQPRVFVDISEYYEQKKEAPRCFVSQKDKYYMKEDFLDIFHTHEYPNLHGINFCESFQIERLFI
jgi:LmbE family N-acetylglucosaminyl deacetylase